MGARLRRRRGDRGANRVRHQPGPGQPARRTGRCSAGHQLPRQRRANGQDIYGDANSEGEVHSAGCTAADNYGAQFTIYTNADQATLNTNMAALLSSAAAPGGSDPIRE